MNSLMRTLAMYFFLMIAFACFSAAQTSDFTVIVLPDVQNETQFYPQVLDSETQWVVNNKTTLNIQAVFGLGDTVNDGADNTQWATADAAFKLLDQAQIPYFVAIGNHDYDGANAGAKTRTALGFNQWFGPARYSGYSWYKGNYNGISNENFYGVLNIGGKNYLVLVLEFVPRDIAVTWAASIIAANPDKEVFVVTHSFLFSDGTRVDQCDTGDMNKDNYGDKLWAKLISQYPNFDTVTSGHITANTGSRRADLGIQGNLVNQMFSNFQELPNGGDGYLRILTFHPLTNTIDVKSYSPYLNKYMTDAADQFTINWHAPAITAATGTISGLARDVNTCKRMPGVKITSGTASTVTDVNGHYTLTFPAGSYTVNAGTNGYYSGTMPATVNNGYDADTNFFLASPCVLSTISPSVTICSLVNNQVVTSPVQITAGATDSNPVSTMQLFIDGIGNVAQSGSIFSNNTTLAPGTHRVTVQAKDSTGTLFKQTIYLTVNPSSCMANPVSPSVTICSPLANATVTSPVNVVALSTNTLPISWMQLYVDQVKATQQAGGSFNASVPLASGTHRLTVQSVDNKGGLAKQTIYVTVP